MARPSRLLGSPVHWSGHQFRVLVGLWVRLATDTHTEVCYLTSVLFRMSYAGGEIAWRLPIAVQLLFAITVIILLFGLPESPRYEGHLSSCMVQANLCPRWLFKKGRDEEAIEVLCAVFDLPPTDPYITSEVANIKHALRVEAGVTSHRALFKKDKLKTRRRIMLAYFGLFMNQMVS